jgi:hypothetical protein
MLRPGRTLFWHRLPAQHVALISLNVTLLQLQWSVRNIITQLLVDVFFCSLNCFVWLPWDRRRVVAAEHLATTYSCASFMFVAFPTFGNMYTLQCNLNKRSNSLCLLRLKYMQSQNFGRPSEPHGDVHPD